MPGAAGFGGFGGGGGGAAVGQNVTPNAVSVAALPVGPERRAENASASSQPKKDAVICAKSSRQFGFVEPVASARGDAVPCERERDAAVRNHCRRAGDCEPACSCSTCQAGKGHIVMFALRPFWRWQTQGTYFLAFNAILNWNHLDAGKPEREHKETTPTAQDQ